MNWTKLKSEGWIIQLQKGMFKNQKVTEYSLILPESEKSYLTKCVLNFKAVSELKKQFGFKIQKEAKLTIWCNRPDCFSFSDNIKEALILTFHNEITLKL